MATAEKEKLARIKAEKEAAKAKSKPKPPTGQAGTTQPTASQPTVQPAVQAEPDYTKEDSLAFVHFQYNEPLRRVVLKIANPDNVGPMVMSDQLKYVLGFNSLEVSKVPGQRHRLVAEHPVDLRGGFYAMYVYCDLVEQQVVGNMLAPLLRIVSVAGDYNAITTQTYNPPHYVPILRKDFEEIEINIKDDVNRPVLFEFGKIVIKLDLRRKGTVLI